jgi:opacity protein-like surface antigen
MKKTALFMLATIFCIAPAQAADWSDMRHGTFVGARLTIGSKTNGKPSAALTIAPTQHRLSHNGLSSMRIGEGIALNLTSGAKPTLTLAGVRADIVLGLHRSGDLDADQKLGVSTGGWIAIGVASAAVVVGGLYLAADHIADCDEGECD